MNSGVYIIKNKENGNFYIGSTNNLTRRRYEHKHRFKKGTNTERMQLDYNKYGYSSFSFEILQYCPTELLLNKEQWFIDKMNPYYNISKNSSSRKGVKESLEVIENKRKRALGNKNNLGRVLSLEGRLILSNAHLKYKYTVLCPDGTIVTPEILSLFCLEKKLHQSHLKETRLGKNSKGQNVYSVKGYKILNREPIK